MESNAIRDMMHEMRFSRTGRVLSLSEERSVNDSQKAFVEDAAPSQFRFVAVVHFRPAATKPHRRRPDPESTRPKLIHLEPREEQRGAAAPID